MIEAQITDTCLTLAINRPEKANALTEPMLVELAQHVENTTAQVLVLTGVGRVFSAGADLDAVRDTNLAQSPQWERLSAAVAGFKGLSVAALNGTAVGGSLGMVLACDLRIAVPQTQFFYPVIKMGVIPPASDPARLAKLVGPAMAKRILLTGAKITAVEAMACGLVDVISEKDLSADLNTLIGPAVTAPCEQLVAIKSLIN